MPAIDKYLDDYAVFKQGYRQQTEDMLADAHYSLGQTPEQKQRTAAVRATLGSVEKNKLKQEADNFIAQQRLDKVAGAYTPPEKMEQIKEVAKVAGVEINTFELDFLIAESLQRLDSGEDPRAEYYDWVESQQKIEDEINSNGTTQEEVGARNGFIDFMGDRETEMRRIIALYAGAAVYGNGPLKEQALERLAFMNFKLSELRRLRVKMQATKDKADEQQKGDRDGLEVTGKVAMTAAMMLAHENMQSRYLRNKSGIDSRQFEQGFGEEFVRFRPVTESREEAENKIEQTHENARSMVAMLTAMRMGKSKEEIERENLMAHQPKVRSLNGFRMLHYQKMMENERATA